MAMVLFCQCGSDKVDVDKWDNQRMLLKCFTCERTAWVDGFTVGKLDFVEQLFGAILDQSRKYRKRNPADREKLLRERFDRKRAGTFAFSRTMRFVTVCNNPRR
jgi:hypothetical protein